MEYEADLYAATHSNAGIALNDCAEFKSANELLDALLRFASYFPGQLTRNTLLHPSLEGRMKRIVQLRDGTEHRERLTRIWQKQQVFFLVVLLTVCFAAVIV